MKRFLKRMNRGVALGLVLAVAFGIYVVADTIGFRDDKPTLRTRAEEIVTAMAQAAVTPEADRSLDAPNRETETAAVARLDAVLQDKMIYATKDRNDNNLFYYGSTREEMHSDVKQTLLDSDHIGVASHAGYVTDCKLTDSSNFSYHKCGVDMAQVTAAFEVEYRFVGNPYLLMFSDLTHPTMMRDLTEEEELAQAQDPTEKSTKMTWYYQFTLKKTDGDWKIAYVENQGWGMSSMNFTAQTGNAVAITEGGERG